MGFIEHLGRQPETYSKKKQYKIEKVLGEGSFGSVKKAVWHKPGEATPLGVAIKCIMKKSVKGHENIVHEEMAVLHGLNHPNVVKLYDFFESKEKFYLVFELAEGGELFDRICEQGRFTENDATAVVRATLSGAEYLHQHNIVHRDLKPENLIYRSRTSDDLVIADFGIARHLATEDEVLTTVCGSPGYAAPEVLNRAGHGKPVDLWSIGIITYTLLCGYTPFRSDDRAELIKETTRAKVEFHQRYWKNVSEEAKDFILTLLKPNPADRPTATESLKHRWLTEHEPSTEHDLSTGLRENWGARRRWRQAINAVRASNRMRSFGSSNNPTPLDTSEEDEGLEGDGDGEDDFQSADEDEEESKERRKRKEDQRRDDERELAALAHKVDAVRV